MKKLILLLMFISTLYVLNAKSEDDSLRVYKLGDISVIGEAPNSLISKSNIEAVSFKTIQSSDVESFSGLQTYIPSARIKTNSRGESLLFLRDAGERQIGLFFDGVPLNIAWDNRFDLSLLPTDIIAKINVNKNGNSILYGPNILGGAVNISSYERAAPGFGGHLKLQGGEAGLYQAALSHDGRIGNLNYLASLSYLKTDGFLLSQYSPDTLTNQNFNSNLRTNTDREFLSLYGRAEYQFSQNDKLGFSILRIDGEKGVAPESDKDAASARFWRYPDWRRNLIALNGQVQLDNNSACLLKGILWYDIFNQQINSYNAISYKNLKSSQKDNDNTFGSRLNLIWNINEVNTLSYVINWSFSKHNETVFNYPPDTNLVKSDVNDYSQNLISSGIDYQYSKNGIVLRGGLLYDYFLTGDAGPYTRAEGTNISDYGFYLSTNVNLNNKFALFVDLTRRTRFPTLRESYSGALGKFLVNPNLQPETGVLSEIGLTYNDSKWVAEIAGFANLYSDMITNVRLSSDEDSLRRYMRINYADVNIYGFDVSLALFPIDNLYFKFNFTYMHPVNEMNKDKPLENKPDVLAGVVARYTFNFGLSLQAESQTIGKQYQRSPDNKNIYVEMKGTTIFNLRIAYFLPIFNNVKTELYARINNIVDTYTLYQLGLPEPGRMLKAGLKFTL